MKEVKSRTPELWLLSFMILRKQYFPTWTGQATNIQSGDPSLKILKRYAELSSTPHSAYATEGSPMSVI